MPGRLLAVCAALLLALPATTLARSAGDDQYNDPYGGGTPRGSSGGSGGGSTGSGGGGGSTGSGASGASTARGSAAASAGARDGSSPAADRRAAAGDRTAAATRKSNRTELPRTGFDVWALALVGTFLLFTGMALRVTVVGRGVRIVGR